jgi:hypothetical protein
MSYRKALLFACAAALPLAIAASDTASAKCHESGWTIPYPGGVVHSGGCPPKAKVKPKAVNVGVEKSGSNKPGMQTSKQGAAGALKKTKLNPQPKPNPPGGAVGFHEVDKPASSQGRLGIHEVEKPASSKSRRGIHDVEEKPAARDQSAVGFNPQPDPMLTRGIIDPNQTRGPSGSSGTGRGVPPR